MFHDALVPFAERRVIRMENGKVEINARTLDISARVRNVLIQNDITDLSEIVKYTKENILQFCNLGVGTLAKLESVCQRYEIRLWIVKI